MGLDSRLRGNDMGVKLVPTYQDSIFVAMTGNGLRCFIIRGLILPSAQGSRFDRKSLVRKNLYLLTHLILTLR